MILPPDVLGIGRGQRKFADCAMIGSRATGLNPPRLGPHLSSAQLTPYTGCIGSLPSRKAYFVRIVQMKKFLALMAMVTLSAGLALSPGDADAKRLGSGNNVGKQRSIPAAAPQRAAPEAPKPNQAVPPTSAAAPGAVPPATPGFLSRFGPALAGLGIGALLGSMLGGLGGLGGLGSGLLMALAAGVVIMLVMRFLAARKNAAAMPGGMSPMRTSGMEFAGAGAPVSSSPGFGGSGSAMVGAAKPDAFQGQAFGPETSNAIPVQPDSPEVAGLMRVAESAFIRLQAANDVRDLEDIRSSTTPEVYAELAMQIRERGEVAQRTEVSNLKADFLELVTEGDFGILSVRYSGLISEMAGVEPQPFNEIWHLRKNLKDEQATWLIAGIQQVS